MTLNKFYKTLCYLSSFQYPFVSLQYLDIFSLKVYYVAVEYATALSTLYEVFSEADLSEERRKCEINSFCDTLTKLVGKHQGVLKQNMCLYRFNGEII